VTHSDCFCFGAALLLFLCFTAYGTVFDNDYLACRESIPCAKGHFSLATDQTNSMMYLLCPSFSLFDSAYTFGPGSRIWSPLVTSAPSSFVVAVCEIGAVPHGARA